MSLHPAVAAVRLGVRRALGDLGPGSRVVVACSGGADSLALAFSLAGLLAVVRRPDGWLGPVLGAALFLWRNGNPFKDGE